MPRLHRSCPNGFSPAARRASRPVSRIARLGAALALLAALPAAAQMSEREARREVAAPRGPDVALADLDFLDAATARALEQYARQLPYYAAIAVSPGEPAANRVSPGAVNYHSPEAASRAALAACNAQRTTGAACVIVAQTRPRGYEPGRLTMSIRATEALRGDFRRLDAPKAFAISPATGQFAFARGDGARALARCNAAAAEQGERDCAVVVAE